LIIWFFVILFRVKDQNRRKEQYIKDMLAAELDWTEYLSRLALSIDYISEAPIREAAERQQRRGVTSSGNEVFSLEALVPEADPEMEEVPPSHIGSIHGSLSLSSHLFAIGIEADNIANGFVRAYDIAGHMTEYNRYDVYLVIFDRLWDRADRIWGDDRQRLLTRLGRNNAYVAGALCTCNFGSASIWPWPDEIKRSIGILLERDAFPIKKDEWKQICSNRHLDTKEIP